MRRHHRIKSAHPSRAEVTAWCLFCFCCFSSCRRRRDVLPFWDLHFSGNSIVRNARFGHDTVSAGMRERLHDLRDAATDNQPRLFVLCKESWAQHMVISHRIPRLLQNSIHAVKRHYARRRHDCGMKRRAPPPLQSDPDNHTIDRALPSTVIQYPDRLGQSLVATRQSILCWVHRATTGYSLGGFRHHAVWSKYISRFTHR